MTIMRSVKIGLAAALFLLASTVPAVAGLGGASVLDQTGKKVQFASAVGSGTTLVVFYKGHF